ncbi:MAG TPA: hypothetical protein DD381_03550 [Lentisphaeria bacterium]|nr:MAG: hypothetical protein A2X47_02700 [Lentisphaerae bacterium GWF2_38_69]HBM15408.1 hypothetical protein [Lentisphaeria bacterium]
MNFNYRKATQLINYFICNSGKHYLSKLELLKLVYLADRYHLRKYGQTITNDEYFAMQYGPVASSVKDILEHNGLLSDNERAYSRKYIKPIYHHQIKSLLQVDYDVISETEVEAASKAIELKEKFGNLVEYTHKFSEWKKHENSLATGSSRIKMDYIDFFDSSDVNIEYCKMNKARLEISKEMYIDSENLEKLWQ